MRPSDSWQHVVRRVEEPRGIVVPGARERAHDLARLAHRDRGSESVARHVADGDDEPAVPQREGVVPVPADLGIVVGGTVQRVEPHRRDVRQVRLHCALQDPEHAVITLETLAQERLRDLSILDVRGRPEPAHDRPIEGA